MNSVSPRRWKLPAAMIVVALYWLAMFVGTHLPIRTTPVGNPYSLDKLEHIVAFATLAVLLSALGSAAGITPWKLSASIVGAVALYALVDESTQTFVSRRTPEVLDWVADVVGAALGIALFQLIRQYRIRLAKPVAGAPPIRD